MPGPPKIPHEFYLDLTENETIGASVLITKIDPASVHPDDEPKSGLLLSADRGAHGADLHLSWQQVRELRDALSNLLHEAGQE